MSEDFNKIKANKSQERLIDGGYGDSDVYLVESVEGSYVRKVYQPERMIRHFKKNSEPERLKSAAGQFLEPYIAQLKDLTTENLTEMYLDVLLEKYTEDTLKMIDVVNNNSEIFTQETSLDDSKIKISFEVIPQGNEIEFEKGVVVASFGQELIFGKNFEQILKVQEAQKRSAQGDDGNYPELFSNVDFVSGLLEKFSVKLVKQILQHEELINGPFPIFNSVHPANVIPVQRGSNEWVFKVTDLSSCLCLDYAILLSYLEARQHDRDSRLS